MSEPVGLVGDRLRSFVERIEHIEHAFVERIEQIEKEIKGLAEGKKEVYAEAKGEGFDVKVLREVVRLRKQDRDERDEHESLLDTYMHAIETASASAPVAEAA